MLEIFIFNVQTLALPGRHLINKTENTAVTASVYGVLIKIQAQEITLFPLNLKPQLSSPRMSTTFRKESAAKNGNPVHQIFPIHLSPEPDPPSQTGIIKGDPAISLILAPRTTALPYLPFSEGYYPTSFTNLL